MKQEPNINSYRDSKTNLNLAGISSKIQDISKYQVDELDAFVAINTKPSDWEMLQTQYRLKELYANKVALEKKADVYRKALIDYSATTSQASQNTNGEIRNKSSSGMDGSGVQINGDAITKIFSLATESKDSEYRQEITSKRITVENQANDLSVQIQKLERRISAASKSIKFTETTKKEYTDLLDKTWDSLSQAVAVVTRIQSMAQKDFVGDSGVLFTVINQPKPYSPNKGRFFLFALISFFGFMFLGIVTTSIQLYLQSGEKKFQK
jgi:predicted  nucleic acid-binding Zn-ribbon protein